ncbi:LVIVD repeat-containing protein [Actinoplanes sp. N902-109]|uniref:LVIVD repeat-containing protein n=1 Tax=Actinoplanes sp. (strain N902-109) TaxID=649831 RepID=UPI0003296589|nr:LVIVD repeat-containing protein [Actinoplanes sp. N902-109]AGL14281.1 LVIVD repeat-containing protein [Actinoplanes sp. N902-109]
MRRQFKRLTGLSVAAIAAGLLTAPTSGVAQAPTDPGTPPGVDEIASSPNLSQIAYVPKTGPFATSTNSDWAFRGKYAFGGNYNGFAVYDISNPKQTTLAAQVLCPGSQNDISISGNLLFLGTDSQRTNDSCTNEASTTAVPGDRWEGIKIFDITDPLTPQYRASVKTTCGSHTQTLVPGKAGDPNVYLYVSSYNLTGTDQPNCALPHDKISIVQVPKRNPAAASVVAAPIIFPDGGYAGGPDGQSPTTGCHDITAYPAKDIAAGACMGDGVLFDISVRTAPRVITTVRDTVNFSFWHSATFNNNATKVVFTDELGGGGRATCNPQIGPDRGADGIYDIVGRGTDRKLVFRSYFKIPRTNTDTENCVAHNGSLIPVPGRDIMVQAWYQGGISVWDFTNSRKPKEIAYWERGPLSATQMIGGGSWSAYWYNGYIYSNDIAKGVDVLDLDDARVSLAKLFTTDVFNAQTQTNFYTW